MDLKKLEDDLNIKFAGMESLSTYNLKKLTVWRRKDGSFKIQPVLISKESGQVVKDPRQMDAFDHE